MEPAHLTDFLAVLPNPCRGVFPGAAQQAGFELLLGLPDPVLPNRIDAQGFDQRARADYALIGLVITAAIMVATAALNWSH
jgi:hypothetical protein